MLGLVSIGFTDSSFVAAILVFLTCGAAIYSIVQMIRILLSDSRFREVGTALFKDRVTNAVQEEADARIATSRLISILDAESTEEVEFSYLPSPGLIGRGPQVIHARREGRVTGLDMQALMGLTATIRGEMSSNGAQATEVDQPQSALSRQEHPVGRVVLAKTWGDEVRPSELDSQQTEFISGLVYIQCRGEELGRSVLEEIEDKARAVYRIEPVEPDSDAEQILGRLTDNICTQIRRGEMEKVGAGLRLYVTMSASYLDVLHSLNAIYTREGAAKERQSIGGGWDVIQWLTKGMRRLIDVSFNCGNVEAVRHAAYLPFAICRETIKFGDHYLFQECLCLHMATYIRLNECENDAIHRVMDSRVMLYISNLFELVLLPEMDRRSELERLKNLAGFLWDIVEFLNRMLKSSHAQNDSRILQDTVAFMGRLPEKLDTAVLRSASESDRYAYLEDLRDSLEKELHVVLFGFGAYVFGHIVDESPSDEEKTDVELFRDEVPSTLSDLSQVFVAALDAEAHDRHDWGWWDIPSDGRVHHVSFEPQLADFYVYVALWLLKDKTLEEIQEMRIPPDRKYGFIYGPEEDSDLLDQALQQAEAREGKWEILPNNAIGKAEGLRQLLQKAVDEYSRNVQSSINGSALVPEKVVRYRENVCNGANDESVLRALFQEFGCFTETEGRTSDAPRRRAVFNKVETKEFLIEEPEMHYPDSWGEMLGHGIGRLENAILHEQILEGCSSGVMTSSAEQGLSEAISRLIQNEKRPNVIIMTMEAWIAFRHGSSGPSFVPKWADECGQSSHLESFEGEYRLPEYDITLPVHVMFADNESSCFVGCLPEFGKLMEANPSPDPERPQGVSGRFLFDVADLNARDEDRQELSGFR